MISKLPKEFEDNFEINSNNDHILNRGEPMLLREFYEKNWKLIEVRRFAGRKVGFIHKNYSRYVCLVEKPATPEEKINRIKKKSKIFVDKHIKSPTPAVYEKFESAFLNENKEGM